MSIDISPDVSWILALTGQPWPEGDEDQLRALGDVWDSAGVALAGISDAFGSAASGVLQNLGGSPADSFSQFSQQLQASLPTLVQSAGQLSELSKNTATQVEYAKYMILVVSAWLLFEIAQWAAFAPEVIPELVTAGRIALMQVLRRLVMSVVTGAVVNVGMDAAVQTIQILKGDRSGWSVANTLGALEGGAIGGAAGALVVGVGAAIAPKLPGLLGEAVAGLPGHVVLGGIGGEAGAALAAGVLGAQYNPGYGLAGGAAGALAGAHGSGGKDGGGSGAADAVEVKPPDLTVPGLLDGAGPGEKVPLVSEPAPPGGLPGLESAAQPVEQVAPPAQVAVTGGLAEPTAVGEGLAGSRVEVSGPLVPAAGASSASVPESGSVAGGAASSEVARVAPSADVSAPSGASPGVDGVGAGGAGVPGERINTDSSAGSASLAGTESGVATSAPSGGLPHAGDPSSADTGVVSDVASAPRSVGGAATDVPVSGGPQHESASAGASGGSVAGVSARGADASSAGSAGVPEVAPRSDSAATTVHDGGQTDPARTSSADATAGAPSVVGGVSTDRGAPSPEEPGSGVSAAADRGTVSSLDGSTTGTGRLVAGPDRGPDPGPESTVPSSWSHG